MPTCRACKGFSGGRPSPSTCSKPATILPRIGWREESRHSMSANPAGANASTLSVSMCPTRSASWASCTALTSTGPTVRRCYEPSDVMFLLRPRSMSWLVLPPCHQTRRSVLDAEHERQLDSWGSLVRAQYRPLGNPGNGAFLFGCRSGRTLIRPCQQVGSNLVAVAAIKLYEPLPWRDHIDRPARESPTDSRAIPARLRSSRR